jgi:hypothetical protein
VNGVVNVGGPEKISFERLARDVLERQGDTSKRLIVDAEARYYGAPLQQDSLVIT